MRKLLGGVIAAVWLIASVVLWAGGLQLVPPPSASHAIGLSVSQAVLLAYHLSGVLETLVGAYLSLALGGLFAGLWLLVEGLLRRVRLAVSLGGAVAVLELALALFSFLRVELLLPTGPNAAGLLNASSIAGQLAAEIIPAALLLAISLGAILVTAQRDADLPRLPAAIPAHDGVAAAKPSPAAGLEIDPAAPNAEAAPTEPKAPEEAAATQDDPATGAEH
ncbi:MAG: hypothetical protein M0Z66_11800 [Thermaerobacter sp.]|nr:hypothetical protein [Thermaerobacter sp.]